MRGTSPACPTVSTWNSSPGTTPRWRSIHTSKERRYLRWPRRTGGDHSRFLASARTSCASIFPFTLVGSTGDLRRGGRYERPATCLVRFTVGIHCRILKGSSCRQSDLRRGNDGERRDGDRRRSGRHGSPDPL